MSITQHINSRPDFLGPIAPIAMEQNGNQLQGTSEPIMISSIKTEKNDHDIQNALLKTKDEFFNTIKFVLMKNTMSGSTNNEHMRGSNDSLNPNGNKKRYLMS